MRVSGLSGNEIYCLNQQGWKPGGIVIGNSVQSLGFVGGIASGLKSMAGGEITNMTSLISEGRHLAISRIEEDARQRGAEGLTGVSTELKSIGGMVEFLAIGSAIHSDSHQGDLFSTACTGQELFCHIDAGYQPRHFVIGNVAYSLGIGRGISGSFRTFARGEVKEFSDLYNHTRHLALERLEEEAAGMGCNAVVDINTEVLTVGGIREMLMVGTGSYNNALGAQKTPVTSELTGEELWNLTRMGYSPVRLVMGTSVYSVGFSGGLSAWFQAFSRGEVDEITRLIYEARENCLTHIHDDASRNNADEVIGTKVFVHEIGSGMVEVLAIGTAIRKDSRVKTVSDQILPQAIIHDRDTFFDANLSGSLGREHIQPTPGKPHVNASPAAGAIGCVIAALILSFVACMGIFSVFLD